MARLNARGFSGDMLESRGGSQDRKREVPGRKQAVREFVSVDRRRGKGRHYRMEGLGGACACGCVMYQESHNPSPWLLPQVRFCCCSSSSASSLRSSMP